jgi:hypothetical protein
MLKEVKPRSRRQREDHGERGEKVQPHGLCANHSNGDQGNRDPAREPRAQQRPPGLPQGESEERW